MGEILWMKFVDECVENLQEVLLTVGVNGLLAEYDRWMEAEGYIKCEHGAYCRHTPNASGEGRGIPRTLDPVVGCVKETDVESEGK